MSNHNRKNIKTLSEIAARYNMVSDGFTSKGHCRWLHRPSGLIVTSISALGNWRDIKNVERTFKKRLALLEQMRDERNGHTN